MREEIRDLRMVHSEPQHLIGLLVRERELLLKKMGRAVEMMRLMTMSLTMRVRKNWMMGRMRLMEVRVKKKVRVIVMKSLEHLLQRGEAVHPVRRDQKPQLKRDGRQGGRS